MLIAFFVNLQGFQIRAGALHETAPRSFDSVPLHAISIGLEIHCGAWREKNEQTPVRMLLSFALFRTDSDEGTINNSQCKFQLLPIWSGYRVQELAFLERKTDIFRCSLIWTNFMHFATFDVR